MKRLNYPQFAVISASDPKEFENELNRTVRNLADYSPTVKTEISGGVFNAIISWTAKSDECLTVADEFHAEGIRHVCAECPLHDVESDKRRKRVSCRYAEMGETRLDSECCEYLYKLLKQNRIELIVPEPVEPGMNKLKGTIR